jgi:hypothetical protein
MNIHEPALPALACEIDKLVTAFMRQSPRRRHHFNVAPRHSPGSPAMVDFGTAAHVADQEMLFHAHAIAGRYGTEARKRAEAAGLKGIVECRRETRKGWEVLDLLTGETFLRPFPKRS